MTFCVIFTGEYPEIQENTGWRERRQFHPTTQGTEDVRKMIFRTSFI
ncbi:unnamed protein product [Acanthoscelides obtectus]|uniref:Uncharacterized protein n=1 Tax=Acanthoscelides obtectus TaxID=200917 RepID=A0A9P0KBN0_ACAOB|nr:unnamed protein product [Acanthoscelides obtectus]CAK1654272.1 hypothetical protein AOBTE_LOCUS18500 [Acanthoscelides obtectus]